MYNAPNNVLSQSKLFLNKLKAQTSDNHTNLMTEVFNSIIEKTYVRQMRLVEDWLSWHNEYYPEFNIDHIQLIDYYKENKHYLIAEYYENKSDLFPLFNYAVILTIPDRDINGDVVATITCASNTHIKEALDYAYEMET